MEKEATRDDLGGITIIGAPMRSDDASNEPPQSRTEPSNDETDGGCFAFIGFHAPESESSRRERRIAGFFLRNLEWISEKAKEGDHCYISFDMRDDRGRDTSHQPPNADDARPMRFIQLCFSSNEFYLDLPDTTVRTAESEVILRDRPQFFFANARRKSKDPEAREVEFNPLQREYVYGEERIAAEDVAFLLFDVWKLPIDVPIEVKAGRF